MKDSIGQISPLDTILPHWSLYRMTMMTKRIIKTVLR